MLLDRGGFETAVAVAGLLQVLLSTMNVSM